MTFPNPTPLLPDETVYSYLARLHGLWGESNHRQTALRWLGKYSASVDQKLPVGLVALSKSTGIGAYTLLYKHTCFPLFAAYSSDPIGLKRAMLSGDGKAIANLSNVSQAGLSRLNASYFCPECLEEDLRAFGVAYWHLEHQFLGVKACIRHGTLLQGIDTMSSRTFFLPPQTTNIRRIQASPIKVRFAAEVLQHNSFFMPASNDDDASLWLEMLPLLRHKRWIRGGNVDMQSLLAAVQQLSMDVFEDKQVISEVVVRDLLETKGYQGHPVKFILLNAAIHMLSERSDNNRPKTNNSVSTSRLLSRCRKLLSTQNYSLREISRRLKCSVGFVRSVAGKLGVAFAKRTQFITPDVESRVIRRAIDGAHRKDIALNEGISTGAVEQIIQGVRGLSVYRQYLRMLMKRDEYRQKMSHAIKQHPEYSRGALKRRFPAVYMWLYKYDKTWLYETLPKAINH